MNSEANEFSILNEQQIIMLRLLKKPLSLEEFGQLKRFAVQLLNKQLDEILLKWETEIGTTERTYANLSQSHFRNSKSDS